MKCKDCVFEESYYEPSFETVCKITNKRTTSLQECTCDDERKAKLREQLGEVSESEAVTISKETAEAIIQEMVYEHICPKTCSLKNVPDAVCKKEKYPCDDCWRKAFGLEVAD